LRFEEAYLDRVALAATYGQNYDSIEKLNELVKKHKEGENV
jgi:hypothetical protein